MRAYSERLTFSQLFSIFLILFALTLIATAVSAWTPPPENPPSGNVPAPINVGTIDQVKSAGLGLNALAVFGNAILSGTNRYLNFGENVLEAGYGIRDNNGVIECKNKNGVWGSCDGGGEGEVGGASVMTSSGTFTASATKLHKITVIGGGGGGGQGGGGAGATAVYWGTLAAGTNYTVTVGNGGKGSTFSTPNPTPEDPTPNPTPNPSAPGDASSVRIGDTIVRAEGGRGGPSSNNGGGIGGTASGGTINISGGDGSGHSASGSQGGLGGASSVGGGGRGGHGPSNSGSAGRAHGSGGGGRYYDGYNPSSDGGDGARGLVIFEW